MATTAALRQISFNRWDFYFIPLPAQDLTYCRQVSRTSKRSLQFTADPEALNSWFFLQHKQTKYLLKPQFETELSSRLTHRNRTCRTLSESNTVIINMHYAVQNVTFFGSLTSVLFRSIYASCSFISLPPILHFAHNFTGLGTVTNPFNFDADYFP